MGQAVVDDDVRRHIEKVSACEVPVVRLGGDDVAETDFAAQRLFDGAGDALAAPHLVLVALERARDR